MANKTMEFVAAPPSYHWVGNGFRVHNFIPGVRGLEMHRMDPFILLDYNAPMQVAPSTKPGGVGVHPHRGFETVSIAYQGKVQHHDSAGGGGIIGTGDVQWMTAAGGVLHKEYHEQEWSRQGGTFHMVQLWVNLPAKEKMGAPRYQAIENGQMGRCPIGTDGSYVEVVAGEYRGVHGPALTYSPMHLMNARLQEGAVAEFSFPAAYNTALLVVQGSARIGGREVPTDHLVKFANDGETFVAEATAPDTVLLVMSGEPLQEPIVPYGPFVMNSREQIRQAFEDFNSGAFGYLED